MTTRLRILRTLLCDIHADLSRPHVFASERVGFLCCAPATLADDGLLLLGQTWHPVADDDYEDDPRVGASIGPAAFRKILQAAYGDPVSIFHVHRHEHRGHPRFSLTDEKSMRKFVPGFFNACRSHPHGALVLSHDSAFGALWRGPETPPQKLTAFEVIGTSCEKWGAS